VGFAGGLPQAQSAACADPIAAEDDHNRAAMWCRITVAGGQFTNHTQLGPVHWNRPISTRL
jgi:hypothetical protein